MAQYNENVKDLHDYDYREAVTEDALQYIRDNYSADEIRVHLEDRSEWEQELNDDLWTADSVTGNGSGSYWCNAWRAEACISHNWDLLADALEEFGSDTDILRQGAEACDVTIRCYLLGEAISAALDTLEDEAEEE